LKVNSDSGESEHRIQGKAIGESAESEHRIRLKAVGFGRIVGIGDQIQRNGCSLSS